MKTYLLFFINHVLLHDVQRRMCTTFCMEIVEIWMTWANLIDSFILIGYTYISKKVKTLPSDGLFHIVIFSSPQLAAHDGKVNVAGFNNTALSGLHLTMGQISVWSSWRGGQSEPLSTAGSEIDTSMTLCFAMAPAGMSRLTPTAGRLSFLPDDVTEQVTSSMLWLIVVAFTASVIESTSDLRTEANWNKKRSYIRLPL